MADEHLEGSPDAGIAAICRAEQRVLITFDLDFLNILQYPSMDYDGIIVLRLARQDRDSVLAILPRAQSRWSVAFGSWMKSARESEASNSFTPPYSGRG